MACEVEYPLDPMTGKNIKYRRIEEISAILTLFFGFIGAFYCSFRIALRVFVIDIISAAVFGISIIIGLSLGNGTYQNNLGFIIIGFGALGLLTGIIISVIQVIKETRRINAIWNKADGK